MHMLIRCTEELCITPYRGLAGAWDRRGCRIRRQILLLFLHALRVSLVGGGDALYSIVRVRRIGRLVIPADRVIEAPGGGIRTSNAQHLGRSWIEIHALLKVGFRFVWFITNNRSETHRFPRAGFLASFDQIGRASG